MELEPAQFKRIQVLSPWPSHAKCGEPPDQENISFGLDPLGIRPEQSNGGYKPVY